MNPKENHDSIPADWIDEPAARLKRKNQVLFPKDSPFLYDLEALLQGTDHRAVVLWALELAEQSVSELEKAYPEETRPREALKAARDWSAGYIKMPLAQRKILDCHGFAKELASKAHIALCHAVGRPAPLSTRQGTPWAIPCMRSVLSSSGWASQTAGQPWSSARECILTGFYSGMPTGRRRSSPGRLFLKNSGIIYFNPERIVL